MTADEQKVLDVLTHEQKTRGELATSAGLGIHETAIALRGLASDGYAQYAYKIEGGGWHLTQREDARRTADNWRDAVPNDGLERLAMDGCVWSEHHRSNVALCIGEVLTTLIGGPSMPSYRNVLQALARLLSYVATAECPKA